MFHWADSGGCAGWLHPCPDCLQLIITIVFSANYPWWFALTVVVKIGTESYHDRALVGGIVDFDPTTIKWLVSRYSQCLAASFSWTENRLACLFPIIKVRRTFPVAHSRKWCAMLFLYFFCEDFCTTEPLLLLSKYLHPNYLHLR